MSQALLQKTKNCQQNAQKKDTHTTKLKKLKFFKCFSIFK